MSHHNNPYPPPNPGAFGSGYPTMQPVHTTGYPPNSGYPIQAQPGYPPQSGFPSSQPSYPSHPGYPSQPGYPSMPGYPPSQPGYPPSQPGYPPSQPGYPPSQPGYPPSQPGYPPAQPGYPLSQPGYPPTQPGYPPSQPAYPSSGHPSLPGMPAQHGYPGPQPGGYPGHQSGAGYQGTNPAVTPAVGNYAGATAMANCFSEMKTHIGELHSDPNLVTATPTVFPAPNFDAVADAKILRKAMKGFGTDEAALIDVICRRSNAQRLAIAQAYKVSFGKDLIENIKSETSGNFENLLVSLLMSNVDFYVKEIHDAMAGMGTEEDVLVEVFCSLRNHEIHTIKAAYKRLYGKDLESELMSDTSGNFKRLLVSLCAGGRDESGQTNLEAAREDANALHQAGENRSGTDESVFNMVLCQRNYQQIKLICEEYQKIAGCSLKDSIRKEFSGSIEDGLVAIVKCTSNKAEFFASQLKKSMQGAGTNDRQLIRLMITRCEIDLQDIKIAFERKYGKTLRSYVSGDTSGDYKYALYALMGENKRSS